MIFRNIFGYMAMFHKKTQAGLVIYGSHFIIHYEMTSRAD